MDVSSTIGSECTPVGLPTGSSPRKFVEGITLYPLVIPREIPYTYYKGEERERVMTKPSLQELKTAYEIAKQNAQAQGAKWTTDLQIARANLKAFYPGAKVK
jgi:hypothetical protein